MPRNVTETCERLVQVLSEKTGIAWTFGYIGDCSGMEGTPSFRDSRSWYAFGKILARLYSLRLVQRAGI